MQTFRFRQIVTSVLYSGLFVIFSAATIGLFAACADDLGNYSYHELNSVSIHMDTIYSGVVGETLQINPELSAKDFDENEYDYTWQVISVSAPTDTAVTLSDARNLDYTMRLSPGEYTLVYTVQKHGSSVFDRVTASLSVRTPLSAGWLVLCDDNGRARLDMHSSIKDKTYTDILAGTTPSEWHTPYAIACLPNANNPESPFYLLTADGTTRLSDNDFGWKEEYVLRYEMGEASDADTRPTTIAENGTGKLIIAGGKPYYCDNTTGDGLFRTARKNRFDVASVVGYDAKSDHMAPVFLMYDTTNRRFVVCAEQFSLTDILGTPTATDVTLAAFSSFYGFPVGNESAFNLPAAGKYVLLHMENTRYDPQSNDHGTTYAVLGNGNERMIYGFSLGDLVSIRYPEQYGFAYGKVISRNISGCEGIAQAKWYAFSSLKNYMYYVSGQHVYRVDLTSETPTAVLQFDLPADEEVTCFKFYLPTQSANALTAYDLIIGTVKADGSGTLRIYDGWTTEGDFSSGQAQDTYTGFARIKDVILREVITEY